MYSEIKKCRICGSTKLRTVVNLGEQQLTGVFPNPGEDVETAPLELVKCDGENSCGLVQLRHSCVPEQMYGMNYGYRSGLNNSMVEHLSAITDYIKAKVRFNYGDVVVDIGSNDGTLLGTYEDIYNSHHIRRIGIDPTAAKFREYYNDSIEVVEDFFSANAYSSVNKNGGVVKKAKVITSIAMFYDLEAPVEFARQISECLDSDGIWVFEQSYMPYMIRALSFDTICQEHLEYYTMRQIDWIMEKAGLKIIDVDFNNINGGSFRITAALKDSLYSVSSKVEQAIVAEDIAGYNSFDIFEPFIRGIESCRNSCMQFFDNCKRKGKLVLGYGASTKGNVLLQYFGLSTDQLPYIAEVNSDKFGKVTPGTAIPIISEQEARNLHPDYFFVLPWHFRNNILEKERAYIEENGVKFVFPLPEFIIEE